MQKILVVRNDKLGDFMLAWPTFALLKNSNPKLKLTALVPRYTASLAEICPYLDEVIIDVEDKKDKTEFNRVVHEIKAKHFDAVITLFSNWHNAKLMWKSDIPYRLAPATKLFQWMYNHRLLQRRSKSIKPEFQYNMDLARFFLQQQNIPIIEPQPPYLSFEQPMIDARRESLSKQLGINAAKKWLFVHSGSGGSANNLSLSQYVELIQGISTRFDCEIILTAGPNESEQAQQLLKLANNQNNITIYDKNDGLVDFACSLACADLFIAGSTGPLHLSAALNVATIGFFPSKRSATSLRWQPINAPGKHLAFCPPIGVGAGDDLSIIAISSVLEEAFPFIERYL